MGKRKSGSQRGQRSSPVATEGITPVQDKNNEEAGGAHRPSVQSHEAMLALAQKQLHAAGAEVISSLEFTLRRMPEDKRIELIRDLKGAFERDDYATGPEILKMLTRIEAGTYRAMPYPEYLQTKHWREVRKAALLRADQQCQICASTRELQVHHRTYANLGSEMPADLVALCDVCHARHHGKRAA